MGTPATAGARTLVEQLFTQRRDVAIGVAVRAGTAPEVAEDAVSDVFLALLAREHRAIDNPHAYLHGAVRNRLTSGSADISYSF
jgi:DNA-directed RNA polymerase specialized sigma24 family protein